MWCLWKERNRRTFEGKELSLPNLKFLFLKTLYKWCSDSHASPRPLLWTFFLILYLLVDKLLAFVPAFLSLSPFFFFFFFPCYYVEEVLFEPELIGTL